MSSGLTTLSSALKSQPQLSIIARRLLEHDNNGKIASSSFPTTNALQSILGFPATSLELNITRRCVIGRLQEDYLAFTAAVDASSLPFVYTRYDSREADIILGRNSRGDKRYNDPIRNPWLWDSNTTANDLLAADLKRTLRGHLLEEYYYGVTFASETEQRGKPPLTPDAEGLLSLLALIEQDCHHITFAHLWIDGNYQNSKPWLERVLNRTTRPVAIIADINKLSVYSASSGHRPNTTLFMGVPANLTYSWHEPLRSRLLNQAIYLARNITAGTVFVAAGVTGKVLIHEMWAANPSNQYIDIGSAIDPVLIGSITRNYQEPSHQARQMDVTWTLNLEGRPFFELLNA
jgi:hypothetical protein